jgi:hypothetical protein
MVPRKDGTTRPKADGDKSYRCLIHKLNENLGKIMIFPANKVECVIKPSTSEIVESI